VNKLHRQVMARVNELREARSLSINYLADFAGVSRGHMSKMLRAKTSPTLRSLEKLAQALGVGVIDLFEPAKR
jgi:transcriptional regulator with XRE-family HTH domain